jgi:hypothetical protein
MTSQRLLLIGLFSSIGILERRGRRGNINRHVVGGIRGDDGCLAV